MAELEKLLQSIHVPIIYITIITLVYKVISKFKPITFITASEVERSLYAKETRLIHKVSHYIFNIILLCLFTTTMAFLIPVKYSNNLMFNIVITLICFVLIVGYLYYFNEYENRKNLFRSKIITFIALIYMSGWLVFPYLVVSGVFINNENKANTVTQTQVNANQVNKDMPSSFSNPNKVDIINLLSVAIGAFLLSSIIPIANRPVLLSLKFSKKRAIYYEDENKKKWFILYPINPKEVLIGDNYSTTSCTENKIIQRELLLSKNFKIIDENEIEGQKTTKDTSGTDPFFIIEIRRDQKMKILLNNSNGDIQIPLLKELNTIKVARETIAEYISKEINKLPIVNANELKIKECCRKIKGEEVSEIWTEWKIADYVKKTAN